MLKPVALADQASKIALGLIALANLLFVISVAAVLLLGMSGARAETVPACSGEDLLSKLEREEPTKLADIRREAAKTLNGKGLLWKIKKDGLEPSYLFGTMHLTDKRVTRLTDAAQTAFDQSNTVIIEATDVLDEKQVALSLMRHPELMMLPGTETLKTLLSPEQAEIVNAALTRRGIPPGSVIKMQPWMLTAAVSIPACEFARRKTGLAILDVKLAEDAQAGGKAIAGLETVISQLQAMASLPTEFHVNGLVQTLQLGDKIDDVFETMIVIYQHGEIGLIWPLFQALLPAADREGYAEFEQVMITTRNYGMVENAQAYLKEGNAFIAVGALHLPGKEGIVELLREQGYEVTRAD